MTAEKLIAALESLELGAPFAEPLAAADAAVQAARAAAAAQVFPREIGPMTADAIATYAFVIGRLPVTAYADGLADLHARALASNPELAALCRSREALDDVGAAAGSGSAPQNHLESHGTAAARAAHAARVRYMTAIAAQLAAVPGHELAKPAKALLACDDLDKRLAAERTRREEHARAELARAEAERKAAAREVLDRTVERVRAAAAVAEDAQRKAALSAHEYRKVRAEALVERLRLSGLRELRAGSNNAVYGIDQLIATAPDMSLEQLERYEAALARHEDV